MPVIQFLFSWARLLLLSSGARISVRSQIDTSVGSASLIGPEGEPWEKGTKYACIQKWQGSSMMSSKGKFVNSFCLANLDKALSIASNHLQFAKEITKCSSSNDMYRIKLCALKGQSPEVRLSYSTKTHVPKSCFRFSSETYAGNAVIEAAVDEKECAAALKLPAEHQKQNILPRVTTTTTTTTLTTTTTTSTTSSFTTTAITSTITTATTKAKAKIEKRGAEVIETAKAKEKQGMEIIEAKSLFTSGAEYLWQYQGKSIKCCVSSTGKPTQLQDMNAEKLPAKRSFGTKTGCGYMFGDTYHNGLRGYKGADPMCPVPASILMKIMDKDHEEIVSLLNG